MSSRKKFSRISKPRLLSSPPLRKLSLLRQIRSDASSVTGGVGGEGTEPRRQSGSPGLTEGDNGNRLDESEIYRQLGRFVVTFQVLESQLVQLGGFARDPAPAGFQARDERQRLLDELRFARLVDETCAAVTDFLDQSRGVPSEQPRCGGRRRHSRPQATSNPT